ncbi:MAG: hypothetical protein IPO92_04795 [Saprospiraceae bacterium]|nr:hypothetical protein [Saprospiraceae bacterium]
MEIKQILLSEHSRIASEKILASILQNPLNFDALMDCFFDKEYRICQRASWPVGVIGEKQPELLIPYLPRMIHNLEKPLHDAIIRNTVRTWQFMAIPDEFQGHIFDICFKFITDPKKAIAIRAFSITVCANICSTIPELREELATAIEDQIEFGSSGFVNRAMKTIKMLRS